MSGQSPGRIIFLNGTSSSGKTTLVHALRPKLPASFCYYASDQLADAAFRPIDPSARATGREMFFAGFHRSIPALASSGLDLLIEHIIEKQAWADELIDLLRGLDVFWVGVHVDQEILAERERQRGDRTIGEALYHLRTHDFCRYDIEVDSTQPLENVTQEIVQAWERRRAHDAS
jgi:chloramphenicol 3-O phosphotransferase